MLLLGVVDDQGLLNEHGLHEGLLIGELVLVLLEGFESGEPVLLLFKENLDGLLLGYAYGLRQVGHLHALHQDALAFGVTHVVHVRLYQLLLGHSEGLNKRGREELGCYYFLLGYHLIQDVLILLPTAGLHESAALCQVLLPPGGKRLLCVLLDQPEHLTVVFE